MRPLVPAPGEAVRLVACRGFDPERNRLEVEFPSGVSLAAMVRTAYATLGEDASRKRVQVWVDGWECPSELWTLTYPKAGRSVRMRIRLGNGNLRSVLLIAATVAAAAAGQFYVGPLLAGAAGLTAGTLAYSAAVAVTTFALTTATTLLFNALVPLRTDQAKDRSPTYTLQGFQNQATPNGFIPWLCGRMRFAPTYIGLPYMEIVNDQVFIRALFLNCYGPVALRKHRFGDTPVEWFNGEDPATADHPVAQDHIQMEVREGWPDDAPITIYDHQVVPTDEVNAEMETLKPENPERTPTVRFSAENAEELEVIFSFPGGLFKADPTSGDNESTRVNVRIRHQLTASVIEDDLDPDAWVTVEDRLDITREKAEAFFYSYRWKPEVRGRYAVECSKVDESDDNDGVSNRFAWIQLYAHRPEYPINFGVPVSVTAIRAKATKKLNNTIATYNVEGTAILPDWNHETEAWEARETRSPAAAFRAALQGPQNIRPRIDDQVNLANLVEFSEFCRLRPAHALEYNRYHDYEASVGDVLSDICAAGRATWRDNGTSYETIIDRPRTVIRDVISRANGWNFEGSREFPDLPDGFRIPFRDETRNYRNYERVVPRPILETDEDGNLVIAGYVENPEVTQQIEAPGKTHPDEIFVEGVWRWLNLLLRPDTHIAFKDLDQLVLARGDLAAFNHFFVAEAQVSGVVRAVAGNTVTLDKPVSMEDGQSYGIRFRRIPDEESDEPPVMSDSRSVVAAVGNFQSVTLSGAGDLPAAGDLFMFGVAGAEVEEVIVTGKEAAENFQARVTFKAHAPEIAGITDAIEPPEFVPGGIIVGADEPPPEDIVVALMVNFIGGAVVGFARVTWTADPTKSYRMSWRKVGATLAAGVDTVLGAGAAVTQVLSSDDDYEVAVQVKNGILSAWTPVPGMTLYGMASGPDTILFGLDAETLAGALS